MSSKQVYNLADIIEWSFSNDENIYECFRGNTFQGEILHVDYVEEEYKVLSEYGITYIDFKDAKLVSKK